MIAPIAAFLCVFNIIFLAFHGHICAVVNDFHYLFNILYKLADDADSRDITQLLFNIFNPDFLFLGFVQNAGNRFHPSVDLFDGRIKPPGPMLANQMVKFNRQLFHGKLVGVQDFFP